MKYGVMYETLLLTDGPHNCHTLTSSIRLAKMHVPLDPNSWTYQLLMKLAFINVDDLLACLHKLCDLHHCILLLFFDLFLAFHPTTVGILRLNICDLVLLICCRNSASMDLNSKLLLYHDCPLLQWKMSPFNEGLWVGHVWNNFMFKLQVMVFTSVLRLFDDLVSVHDPPFADIVASWGMHLGDLADGLERPFDLPWLFQWLIPQEHNEWLHL